jgi:hypothetical protein
LSVNPFVVKYGSKLEAVNSIQEHADGQQSTATIFNVCAGVVGAVSFYSYINNVMSNIRS